MWSAYERALEDVPGCVDLRLKVGSVGYHQFIEFNRSCRLEALALRLRAPCSYTKSATAVSLLKC